MTTVENAPKVSLSAVEKQQKKIERLTSNAVECKRGVIDATNELKNTKTVLKAALLLLKDVKAEVKSLRSKQNNDAINRYHITKKNSKTIHSLEIAKMELELITKDEKQPEEKKSKAIVLKNLKKGIFTDPLMQKINSLPHEIVDIIGTFLPIEIHIQDLEYQRKTSKLLSRCSAPLKMDILTWVCTMRSFLSILSYEDALKEVSTYQRYHYCSTSKNAEVKLLHLIETAKTKNPRFAYNVLRKLHCLIDPTKKYKSKKLAFSQPSPFTALTMEDLHHVHFEF